MAASNGLIEDPVKLGYPGWGAGSIGEKDWQAMKDLIIEYGVTSIVEVGIGLSTLLMQQMAHRYVGYDTLPRHIEKMRGLVQPHVELRQWDGSTPIDLDEDFDMAFIDGPQGAKRRFPSFIGVMGRCKVLCMHDVGYIYRDEWCKKLDPDGLYKVVRPGGRFSAWVRDNGGPQ